MTAIGNSNNTFKLLHRELATHPQGHSDRFETLCSLAARLGEGFVETSRVSLLEEALKLAHEALEFYAPDPKRHHFLDILVTLLHYHHTRFGDKASLDDAERYSQEIITLCPLGSPMHDRALIIFATVLRERALNPKYAPDPNDIRPLLERSLSHAESALELRPEGHPQRDDALEALSLTLFGGRRWLKDDTRRTVDRAILLGRAALALRPPGHPKRRTALQNLAYFLTVKYDQSTIETASLDEGVELNKEALELCPVGHFFRADILVIMAYQYRLLWFRDDNIYFRNEADHASEGALQSLPCDHLRYPNISRMRALALYDEYLHSGKIASLDRSIKLTQDSLALLSLHLRYNGLITLGNMLRSRYQLLGDMQSLTEAINIFTKALDTCPPNNDNRIFALHNMGVILHYEYNLSQNASSLNEASRFLEESTRICPETHSQYGWVRLELASVLLDRYRLQSIPEDYDCSVAIIRDLLSRSELSAIRNEALPVLADALYLKYQECQEAALFKESIEYYGSAILRYPTGNRELHSNIASLSNAYLCAHYSEKNVALSIQYVLEIVQDKYGPPRSRFIEAKKLLSKLHDHWHDVSREKEEVRQNLLSAYQEIIKLLPLLANFGLNLPSRLRELSLAQSLGSDAVTFALSCNEGNTSVEMSENSRSIFWSQALHLRDARFDLLPSAAGQELQDLFEALARPWSSGSDGRIDEDLANRRGMSERVYQILGEVRQIDGLDRFLLGQPFLLLARAADKGPVVILTPNKHGCNALVLLSSAGNWKSIPLPSISLQSLSELVAQTTQFGLSRGERVDSRENDLPRALKVVKFRENRLTSTIAAILRDIWNKIVWPILKVLGVQVSCFLDPFVSSFSCFAVEVNRASTTSASLVPNRRFLIYSVTRCRYLSR
jgi:hypothetical protein